MGLIAFSRLAVSKRNALDDPNQLAPNLNAYINGFSRNVREIMERFARGRFRFLWIIFCSRGVTVSRATPTW